eukprot:TRINITY_DN567_c0_g1_i2.p1 TRINITY_DN567_c0_g1~~TRINITY_DN567_c0_g1_i2.p1  ORF type:complete len:414 (-),score=82.55 TRINITY_DN567_c0_g1_i2:449-1690(-)
MKRVPSFKEIIEEQQKPLGEAFVEKMCGVVESILESAREEEGEKRDRLLRVVFEELATEIDDIFRKRIESGGKSSANFTYYYEVLADHHANKLNPNSLKAHCLELWSNKFFPLVFTLLFYKSVVERSGADLPKYFQLMNKGLNLLFRVDVDNSTKCFLPIFLHLEKDIFFKTFTWDIEDFTSLNPSPEPSPGTSPNPSPSTSRIYPPTVPLIDSLSSPSAPKEQREEDEIIREFSFLSPSSKGSKELQSAEDKQDQDEGNDEGRENTLPKGVITRPEEATSPYAAKVAELKNQLNPSVQTSNSNLEGDQVVHLNLFQLYLFKTISKYLFYYKEPVTLLPFIEKIQILSKLKKPGNQTTPSPSTLTVPTPSSPIADIHQEKIGNSIRKNDTSAGKKRRKRKRIHASDFLSCISC